VATSLADLLMHFYLALMMVP